MIVSQHSPIFALMHQILIVLKKYLVLLLLYLLIFQISRLYFILYNFDLIESNLFYAWIQSAYHGLRLDISASSYCTAPFILIWLVEAIIRKKLFGIHKAVLIISIFLIQLITIADSELFRAWGNKFNSQVLVYISHPMEMALSAGAINGIKTLGFTIVLIFLSRQFYIILWKVVSEPIQNKSINYFTLLMLTGFNFILIRGGLGVAAISQSAAIYSEKSINNASAVNSLWNALYFITTNTESIYGEKLNYLSNDDAKTLLDEQLTKVPDTAFLFSVKKPNILIVMLESFTANASHYFSGQNNCTPFMDSVAKHSLSFMKCYASGDRTEKGLVSVLSGYPAQPSSSIIVFPDKMSTLPSISRALKKEGYNSLFVYGGDAEFASMKSYLIVQQFDEIFDKQNFNKMELNNKWGAHDEYLYKNTLSQLNLIKKPFFSTIMTLSSHEPFDVPYTNSKLKKDEWYGLKNSIEYADQCLYRFIENCKKEAWYSETIIILVADHGHDIGLKNVHYFGPEKYHIPMIITGGALKAEYHGKKVENYVSQTVIPELLLSQLGLPTADFKWQTSAFNPDGFAQYIFNNGFGRISNQQQCIFDNESAKCYAYKGSGIDSLSFLNNAKAFQQLLVKDFLSK